MVKDHPRRPGRPGCIWYVIACEMLLVSSMLRWDAAHYSYFADGPAAPRPIRKTKAGLIYLRVEDPKNHRHVPGVPPGWPNWLPALEASAAASADEVTFYFAGAPANLTCPNCVSIPTDVPSLLDRIEKYLNVSRGDVQIKALKHKVCDLKPMWPTLFPEVAARHEFVGFADADVLFGDLASEVAALGPADDLLVPSSWHPFPLANGNFMLFRSEPRVLNLFTRASGWRHAVRSAPYSVFDEWHGRGPLAAGSFMAALLDAQLNGEIRPKPTNRLFVQDVVPGGNRNLWDRPAKVVARWTGGQLLLGYKGPCQCSKDLVPQFTIAQCAECVKREGETLADRPVTRTLEVLAYHVLSAKHWIQPVPGDVRECPSWSLRKSSTSMEHTLACDGTR